MGPHVQQITELSGFQLGEGPHWDEETQSLYFVDIIGKSVHKYVPSTKKHTTVFLEDTPSFIIPVKDSADRFIVSLGRSVVIMTWDGVSSSPDNIEELATLDESSDKVNTRINDGKADPLGNLWAGTMERNADHIKCVPLMGSLYSLSQKRVKKHENNICIANGLAWSKDLKNFYYIDSGTIRVDQYDLDANTLTISNRRPLFTFLKHGIQGYPDGQTIDSEGNLWVAVFQGQKVLKISTAQPETLLESIDIPEYQVTSVAFGGPELDELYVTTAKLLNSSTDSTKTQKGGVYKITGLGVKGLPGDRVRL
ncbi:hypothetical protein FQA39_LY06227 [Lamprigera yunnana]|nr:hypothetical protein FQA39_LY06227 [Lamprigera yunnana]